MLVLTSFFLNCFSSYRTDRILNSLRPAGCKLADLRQVDILVLRRNDAYATLRGLGINDDDPDLHLIQGIQSRMRENGVVVINTYLGYLLCCDSSSMFIVPCPLLIGAAEHTIGTHDALVGTLIAALVELGGLDAETFHVACARAAFGLTYASEGNIVQDQNFIINRHLSANETTGPGATHLPADPGDFDNFLKERGGSDVCQNTTTSSGMTFKSSTAREKIQHLKVDFEKMDVLDSE